LHLSLLLCLHRCGASLCWLERIRTTANTTAILVTFGFVCKEPEQMRKELSGTSETLLAMMAIEICVHPIMPAGSMAFGFWRFSSTISSFSLLDMLPQGKSRWKVLEQKAAHRIRRHSSYEGV
jgi:hypothetical protein